MIDVLAYRLRMLIKTPDPGTLRRLSFFVQEEGPNREELEATKKAIETAHMICSRASDSHAELQVEVPTLFECIR